jgi:hypothetical protein
MIGTGLIRIQHAHAGLEHAVRVEPDGENPQAISSATCAAPAPPSIRIKRVAPIAPILRVDSNGSILLLGFPGGLPLDH